MKENKTKADDVRNSDTAVSSGKFSNFENLRDFQKKLLSAIMIVNVNDMSQRMLNPDTKIVFRYLNDFLSRIIPVVESNGGEVDKISEDGLMALYKSEIKNALISAVSICQKLTADSAFELDFSQFAIAICFGYIMSGVVGDGRTYTNITLSEYTGLTQYLQQNATKYGAHIIVSESYSSQVQDFDKRFNTRYIGLVYLKRSDTYEKLYDVFDGDPMEERNNKMKTKVLFEKAVNFFISRKYNDARAYFIEVLKSSRNDKAAKEYLYLCDSCMISNEKGEKRNYLEVWG